MPGLNLLDSDARKKRQRVFGVTCSTHNMTPGDPDGALQYLWCVENEWKLIERHHGKDTTQYRALHSWDQAPFRLYNINSDPHEQTDLADRWPDVVSRLHKEIQRSRSSLN